MSYAYPRNFISLPKGHFAQFGSYGKLNRYNNGN